jgi:polyribonucleotide nucleotidyltransferase
MIPEDCPYTVRVVSEVLESNGSSSMATVCSGTMALMDAGVQITRPVSGIAMGLISDGERYAVLSDILGDEDHLGDMDFKVTGTSEGITACQMDIKIKGLSYEILVKALKQARDGRLHILEKITDTIEKPNPEVKAHSPKMVTSRIPNEFIGPFIGPGGKVIQELQKTTGCTIVINEDPETEEGIVEILGTDQEGY